MQPEDGQHIMEATPSATAAMQATDPAGAATVDPAERAAEALRSVGCCWRCVLRLTGGTDSTAYSNPPPGGDADDRVCVVCMGSLQCVDDPTTVPTLTEMVRQSGHDGTTYSLAFSVPSSTVVRQRAILAFLSQSTYAVARGRACASFLKSNQPALACALVPLDVQASGATQVSGHQGCAQVDPRPGAGAAARASPRQQGSRRDAPVGVMPLIRLLPA